MKRIMFQVITIAYFLITTHPTVFAQSKAKVIHPIPAEYDSIYRDVQRTTFQYFWDGDAPVSGRPGEGGRGGPERDGRGLPPDGGRGTQPRPRVEPFVGLNRLSAGGLRTERLEKEWCEGGSGEPDRLQVNPAQALADPGDPLVEHRMAVIGDSIAAARAVADEPAGDRG